jgi:hypothetical protein
VGGLLCVVCCVFLSVYGCGIVYCSRVCLRLCVVVCGCIIISLWAVVCGCMRERERLCVMIICVRLCSHDCDCGERHVGWGGVSCYLKVFCDFIDRSERFLFFFSNGVCMVVFVIFFAMFSSFANMI